MIIRTAARRCRWAVRAHYLLIELLEMSQILSLHVLRLVGREWQVRLKIRALCGEVERVFNVLVDISAQVSLVKAGLLPPGCQAETNKWPVHGGR